MPMHDWNKFDTFYVELPLEVTYQETWDTLPSPLRQLVE